MGNELIEVRFESFALRDDYYSPCVHQQFACLINYEIYLAQFGDVMSYRKHWTGGFSCRDVALKAVIPPVYIQKSKTVALSHIS